MNEMTRNAIIAFVACVLIISYAAFAIPFIEYCKAVSLQENGKIIEAYDAFVYMDDYLDAEERVASLYEQYKVEKFKAAEVGSTIYFGTYEQDNDATNGKEDIQWRVLAIEDGKALIISRQGLTYRQYHERDEDVTWETCTLRAWLNETFWNEAFSEEEKGKILTVTVPVDKNIVNVGDQGNPTEDRVFILSRKELETYLEKQEHRSSRATEQALAECTPFDSATSNGWYWTRTAGRYSNQVLSVDGHGEIGKFGDSVTKKYYTVRPAIWITLGDN